MMMGNEQKCLMCEIAGFVICGLGTCNSASRGLFSTAEHNVVHTDTMTHTTAFRVKYECDNKVHFM